MEKNETCPKCKSDDEDNIFTKSKVIDEQMFTYTWCTACNFIGPKCHVPIEALSPVLPGMGVAGCAVPIEYSSKALEKWKALDRS